MNHPLTTKVNAVRHAATRAVRLRGVSLGLAAVLGSGTVIGLVDYMLRSEELGVRLIFSLLILGATIAAVMRWIVPSLKPRLSDVQVAQYVERRFPQLSDRLSSAVQFLEESEDDPMAGSAALRKAVVADAMSDIQSLDLKQALNYHAARKALGTLCAAVAIICLFAIANSSGVKLAAQRMLLPWEEFAWPRHTNLVVIDPIKRLAVGDDFRLAVKDALNRELPEDLQVSYWVDGTAEKTANVRTMEIIGSEGVHQLFDVTQDFSYLVVGGDDQKMTWQEVKVVEPPRIASLQIKVHPPKYTGWPIENAGRHLRVLAGSRVEIEGTATRPITAARLDIDTLDKPKPLIAQITSKRLGFKFEQTKDNPWTVRQSGNYSIALRDEKEEHFRATTDSRWELEAVTDSAPTISLERPADNTEMTPAAVVPLKLIVKDDLEIARVTLRFTRSDQSEQQQETEIPLFVGLKQATPRKQSGLTSGQTDSRTIEHVWDLTPLSLPGGTVLTYHVIASDYSPQEGQSQPHRILIISSDELEDRVARRQSQILDQLNQALKAQRQSRSQTVELSIQFGETKEVGKQQLDELQSAELNQRQVQRLIADPQNGILSQIKALLDELANNRVDNPETVRQMTHLAQKVTEISKDPLPRVERGLISSLKGAQEAFQRVAIGVADRSKLRAPLLPDTKVALDKAGDAQDEVIKTLEDLLGGLSQWDSYRRFAVVVRQLRRDQEELSERSGKLRLETLSQDITNLTPEQRAAIKVIAQRQLGLARQLDGTLGRMRQAEQQLAESDPLASETIADALDLARRRAIAGQMRQAGREAEQNHLGKTSQLQQQVDQNLEQMLDALSNRKEHELGRLVKKLKETAGDLGQLHKEQKGLRKKMEQAASMPAGEAKKQELQRLSRQQEELAKQSQRLARRLERLRAQAASQSAQSAAASQSQAAQAGEQGQQEQALDQAKQAEADLEKAEQQLQEAIKQAEKDLAQEQLEKMQQRLAALVKRQQAIVDEIDRLAKLLTENNELTDGQSQSVKETARNQQLLISETSGIARQIAAAKVFHLALIGATDAMQTVAEQLADSDLGPTTHQAALDALARLQRLVDALKNESQQEEGTGGGGGGGGQSPPQDGIGQLAQLKLLRMMQDHINERTEKLEKTRAREGNLSEPSLLELDRLTAEQGRVAELVFELSRPVSNNSVDDPDSLPELDPLGEELNNTLLQDELEPMP